MSYTDAQRRPQQQQTSYSHPQSRKGAWNSHPATGFSAGRPALAPRSTSNYLPQYSSHGPGSNNMHKWEQHGPGSNNSHKWEQHGPGRNNTNRWEQQQQHHQQQWPHNVEIGVQNTTRKAQLYVRYSELSIRRVFVASVDPGVSWSTTLLKFEPISETSLAHLFGERLYTLALCQTPGQIRERSAELYTYTMEKHSPPKTLCAREVIDSVIDNLYADMSLAMDYVRSYLESRFWVAVKPRLWLKFGRILFHSRQNRSNLALHKPFDTEGLEKALHGPKHEDSVLKTFDTGVSHDYFRKIRALVGGNGVVPESKEMFIIQVADATQPRNSLICTCKRRLTSDGPRLTLCNVRMEPLRHMVADFACMEQELDLRLILTTRQEFRGDTSALQTIVDRAVYDVKAEGGLSWPLGSTSLGPYTVTGASHVIQTNLKSHGCKWKLRHANRTALNAVSSRFSYEIDVTGDDWGDQFQVWKDLYQKGSTKEICQYVDCFFKPLSTLLTWVWENCI